MKFDVTYQVVTPESASYGEAEDSGFEAKNISLREAIGYMCCEGGIEADSSHIDALCPPRWFTAYKADEDYSTDEETSYSLHLPDNITGSSAMRIARLIGCYGV